MEHRFHLSLGCWSLFAFLALAITACDGSTSDTTTGGSGGTGATGGGGSGGSGGSGTTTSTTVDPFGPWSFEAVTVDGLTAVWGGIVATETPERAYLVGGVSGTNGPVTGGLIRVEQGASAVTATAVTAGLTERYCGCAMLDPMRQEIVVIGGRDSTFSELKTAELADLSTGTVTPLDATEVTAHPVGCHAVFLPDRDVGYVFGGAGQGVGFTGNIWRYSPVDKSFTMLAAQGPKGRYDGAFRYPHDGGPVWLIGGMGLAAGGPDFYSDVWQFDPESETWTDVTINSAAPPGRRLPWVAFTQDASALVMGFGSDSAQGASMLGDLWRLDIATGMWSSVSYTGDIQAGERGFATWLPGPSGSAGLLSGGLESLGLSKQALVLRSPVDEGWR